MAGGRVTERAEPKGLSAAGAPGPRQSSADAGIVRGALDARLESRFGLFADNRCRLRDGQDNKHLDYDQHGSRSHWPRQNGALA